MQQPDFRKLWLAQFVSVFGDFLALFGVISLIMFRWHGNAVQVTFVMVAYMLPLALVGLLALGFSTGLLRAFANIPMAAASLFGLGLAISFVIVPAQTLMQQETPHALIGRVSSSFMSLISVAQVTGLLLSGWLAQRLGVRHLFLAAAVALGAITVIGYTRRGEAQQQVAAETEG